MKLQKYPPPKRRRLGEGINTRHRLSFLPFSSLSNRERARVLSGFSLFSPARGNPAVVCHHTPPPPATVNGGRNFQNFPKHRSDRLKDDSVGSLSLCVAVVPFVPFVVFGCSCSVSAFCPLLLSCREGCWLPSGVLECSLRRRRGSKALVAAGWTIWLGKCRQRRLLGVLGGGDGGNSARGRCAYTVSKARNDRFSFQDKGDEGIMREALLDFYSNSRKMKSDQIIIFKDGVSESQFNQILNKELDQVIETCKFLDENWNPKFVVIVAQKNHHTNFFQQGSPGNVQPGTAIDNKVCHPKNNDFYLCAHAGMIETTRPTHYHVLLDQVGFSADDLQELVHSLSYVYQRSTTAISVGEYTLMSCRRNFFEDASETSSSHAGVTVPGAITVPQLPRLKENVSSSMFF
ncbi:hypothetical protein F3Y22_tig00000764pilonHSYRG00037 [Hibiscus syriacus]|uniref:Piwi domain-containing protein n=1 Tax=Hibiscus syriacus TaxID=106335 RepID=A0A6A3CZ74_HIBSY|nr:hypothetical protein F3Y22_tig00000764pilonHSYRG00037 [Hibiscus syriacus]